MIKAALKKIAVPRNQARGAQGRRNLNQMTSPIGAIAARRRDEARAALLRLTSHPRRI
jgi:uncharacterized protein YjiS (DUF1127 family)